jgi:hypothetical protein
MTVLESPALSTQTVRTLEAPSSSGGGGGSGFLKEERVVLERRRLYCDSEREMDMVWVSGQLSERDRAVGGGKCGNKNLRQNWSRMCKPLPLAGWLSWPRGQDA